jgi:hypothetical protein
LVSGEIGSPGGCEGLWNCEQWSECVNGMQIRSCEDIRSCGTENKKPEISRDCMESESQDINGARYDTIFAQTMVGVGIIGVIGVVVFFVVRFFIRRKQIIRQE